MSNRASTPRSRAARAPDQFSLDDLGTPLHQVTFCVIDIETTGGRPIDGGITEVGAVKLRGGDCLGTFQTLVDPGVPIPPQITVLTGITEAMVLPAPRIAEVLPALLEFVGDAVIVGHNVRYDLGFLNASLKAHGRGRFSNRSVDTCALARRLVRDEVPNCKLGTLADRFRLDHQPSHRALDDALATGDLLHVLLERAAGLGVTGLDDLLVLPKLAGHPQVAKLRMTDHLPRAPGVYLFRDTGGRILYVGTATDLRARVRSYFSGDERRKVGQLLREVAGIDHIGCTSVLEAAVLEVRLIHHHDPRFNRHSRRWQSYPYLKLTAERFPRLSIVPAAKPDGCLYLGPLSSHRAGARIIEAIHTALPIRRCAGPPGRRASPCGAAQLGRALCPCSGDLSPDVYAPVVAAVRAGLTHEPTVILGPLRDRMDALAAAERFEEAADTRDRAHALTRAMASQRRLDSLRRSGLTELFLPGGSGATLEGGRLIRAWGPDGQVRLPDVVSGAPAPDDPDPDAPAPRAIVDELACVASWLDRSAGRVRIDRSDGGLAQPWPALPTFAARSLPREAPRPRVVGAVAR